MRNKYWTSDRPKELVSERREQLALLFEFVNADLDEEANARLNSRIQDLLNDTLIGRPEECPGLVDNRDDFLIRFLQEHLRRRFDEIIQAKKLLVEMPWLSLRGSLKILIDAKSGRFTERFFLHNIKMGDERSMLKRLMDVAIINIIRDLNSKPTRFHQCPRCGTYYYQPTERAKNYCSTRCNDAARLQEFRKKRSLSEDNESE